MNFYFRRKCRVRKSHKYERIIPPFSFSFPSCKKETTYLFTANSVLPNLVFNTNSRSFLCSDTLGLFETLTDRSRGDLGVFVVAEWGEGGREGELEGDVNLSIV